MGYTGNNHHARKEEMIHDRELIYDAKKQLHRADESYKHSPSKMYGDPAAKMYDDAAPKFNDGLRAASAAGKLSGKFEDAVNAAPKMSGDMGHNVLAEDMTPDSQSIVGGDMGYAGSASGAPAPMMEALGKPALMMKKGIASMCGMKK